jgi:hypothetical protein
LACVVISSVIALLKLNGGRYWIRTSDLMRVMHDSIYVFIWV